MAIKFYTYYGSITVMPCAKFWSNHYIRICKSKINLNQIWIMISKSITKWMPATEVCHPKLIHHNKQVYLLSQVQLSCTWSHSWKIPGLKSQSSGYNNTWCQKSYHDSGKVIKATAFSKPSDTAVGLIIKLITLPYGGLVMPYVVLKLGQYWLR